MKRERFDEYFDKYKDLVFRVAMDMIYDYQTAQEISQKVFMAFYLNMDRVAPDGVKPWLIRSTQHAVIDYTRKAQTRKEVFLDAMFEETGSSLMERSLDLYQNRMNDRELAGRIFQDLKVVNKKWFDLMMLCFVDGLSYTEAAQILHTSEPVLRARMRRARAYVKKTFGAEYRQRNKT